MAARRSRRLGSGAQACGCRVMSQSDALIAAVVAMLDRWDRLAQERKRRRLARRNRHEESKSELSTVPVSGALRSREIEPKGRSMRNTVYAHYCVICHQEFDYAEQHGQG